MCYLCVRNDFFYILSMNDLQKYVRPTLLCVIFMVVGIFYAQWSIPFLTGMVALAFSYWGLANYAHEEQVKGPFMLLFYSHLVPVALLIAQLVLMLAGVHFLSQAGYVVTAVVWIFIALTGTHMVAKVVAGAYFIRKQKRRLGIAMIACALVLCVYSAFMVVNIIPPSVAYFMPKLLCLAYGVEALFIYLAIQH